MAQKLTAASPYFVGDLVEKYTKKLRFITHVLQNVKK